MNRHRGQHARARGFTLIELLVTVVIVGILSTMAFPMVGLVQQRAHEQDLREALRTIRTALDQYRQAVEEGRIIEENKGSGYPPSLAVLVDGVVDAKSPGRSNKIYFLRRLPRDPFAPEPSTPDADTWGLRSYASPPEDPQPGADVFDVYSLAPGKALNGTAYRDW